MDPIYLQIIDTVILASIFCVLYSMRSELMFLNYITEQLVHGLNEEEKPNEQ